MPVGISDFKRVREQYYFVDKTDFIRQIIENHSDVTLITRPRRFGKTLMMSMLDYFFSMDKKEISQSLFSGLVIEQYSSLYTAWRGMFPVIFMSLKDCRSDTWHSTYQQFVLLIQREFQKHRYLLESTAILVEEKKRIQRFLEGTALPEEYERSLWYLASYMTAYFGRKPIILIDEYDAPLQHAYSHGFYQQAIVFFRNVYSIALKENEFLEFAVLTGVLRIAKESIFSGLNNLDVYSILRDTYQEIFGFTTDDVKQIAADFSIENHLPELKSWYDGYRFGSMDIYNPWSVINYISHQCRPMPYWVNTSENTILKELLPHAGSFRLTELQALLRGQTIMTTLNDSVIYDRLWQDDNTLYTMLLTTGYLTVAAVSVTTYNRYALRIPNEEIRQVYSTEILNTVAKGINRNAFDGLFDALFNGNVDMFEQRLQQILEHFVSSFDTAQRESFYHGFMLGMTSLFVGKGYYIESNRESGYGRFDLAIFPQQTGQTGVIMEFKVASSVDALPEAAAQAVQQIQDRHYAAAFQNRQITQVWQYGIAFYGKQVKIIESS